MPFALAPVALHPLQYGVGDLKLAYNHFISLTNTSWLLSAPDPTLFTKPLGITNQSISTVTWETNTASITSASPLTSAVFDCSHIDTSSGCQQIFRHKLVIQFCFGIHDSKTYRWRSENPNAKFCSWFFHFKLFSYLNAAINRNSSKKRIVAHWFIQLAGQFLKKVCLTCVMFLKKLKNFI